MNIRYLIPFLDSTVKDWSLTARLMRWLTFLWLAIGLFFLLSASDYHGASAQKDRFYYVIRQAVAIFFSLHVFNWIVHSPLKNLLKFAKFFAIGILGLLLLTAFGVGKTTMGSSRWIGVGPIQIQPSELIKPFLVLQSAVIFGRWKRHSLRTKVFWTGVFALVLMAILKQPNLSTTVLCATGLLSIAFMAGLQLRYLAGITIFGVVVAGISILKNEYQLSRIKALIDPWGYSQGLGYHSIQSFLAIGSGGLWGRGFGLSQQKLGYLPIQDTDFIFSVFAEEFGLIGCILLLILVMSYAAVGLSIALRSDRMVHRLVAMGATIFIVLQSLFNIGVAVGVLPPTGLPLPMFSYGANSIFASSILSALIVRVARESAAGKVIPLMPKRSGA